MSFQSLWAATAPDVPAFPRLTESLQADVLVIGAGFQGLSAALHLAEAGVDVVVLEAGQPGSGASGRNGGQVIPGLKDDPDALDRLWGPQATEFAGSTADVVFDLVARLGLDCDAVRDGWIQAGTKPVHLAGLHERMAQWAARGAPVQWLEAEDMAREIGSQSFAGGWIDRRAGKLHPLKYARELARVATAAGARIFGGSPVASLLREGTGWRAELASGPAVRAERVLLATNVYTPPTLNRDLARATVPANSFQIATRPLPPALLAQILPNGAVVSEARRVGTYFRIGPGNRLMLGGRGQFSDPTRATHFRRIEAEMRTRFGSVLGQDIEIEHRWFGRVGMTADHRIRICEPEPGMLLATGFNGRGVALSTALGKAFAAYLTQGAAMPFPVAKTIKTLPFHALHALYGTVAIEYYRLRDRFD
ncbi:NAD(P)/FAD-dependent oxidoreductase [Thioclava atlantica]|uniref:FAD dependent oxidoreductase n=1 Tax=Thioclava atlantica TaxID=1317124 RepID=A0A085TSB0_9RHOB|nr:FAD-dependent oxidoreductase [Thioclava atlantica]KFE33607.1 FAD dependent oxidoreductase [Thioclava atlantica]